MKENAESSVACNHHRVGFLGLLVTLGIVFGDIGTSPLYVMKAILHTGETINESTILGALSCIIWTLTLQTTIKYVCVALRADNNGEGGILALYALLRRLKTSGFTYWPSLAQAPCWQTESSPLPSRLPQPSKDSKASVPTCQSSPSPLPSSPSSSSCSALAQRVLVNRLEYSCCYGSCCWAWWELSASRLTH